MPEWRWHTIISPLFLLHTILYSHSWLAIFCFVCVSARAQLKVHTIFVFCLVCCRLSFVTMQRDVFSIRASKLFIVKMLPISKNIYVYIDIFSRFSVFFFIRNSLSFWLSSIAFKQNSFLFCFFFVWYAELVVGRRSMYFVFLVLPISSCCDYMCLMPALLFFIFFFISILTAFFA